MHQDTTPHRPSPSRALTLNAVLVVGAAVALLVLVGLALAAWLEQSA